MLKKIQQLQAHVEMLMRRRSLVFVQGVPSPREGKVGDFRVNELTGDIYGPKALNSWGLPTGNILGGAKVLDIAEIIIADQVHPATDVAFTLGAKTDVVSGGNISVSGNDIVLKKDFVYKLEANFHRVSMQSSNREGSFRFRNITNPLDLGIGGYITSRVIENPWRDGSSLATAHIAPTVDTTINLVSKALVATITYNTASTSPAGLITIRNLGSA